MTYIISLASAEDLREEYIFTSNFQPTNKLFDETSAPNILYNHNAAKNQFFSYSIANSDTECNVIKNTLGFDFDANNVNAGFYHLNLSLCFVRYNSLSTHAKNYFKPVEIVDRYSYFSGTESTDPESISHCRFLFHGDNNKKTPTTNYGSIDYFKYNNKLTVNTERFDNASKYRAFTQLDLEYTFESTGSVGGDNILPTFSFYSQFDNGTSVSATNAINLISIYNVTFKLTKFDSTNNSVISLFS